MSRRCKEGQRARVVGDNCNAGIIVVINAPYFYPRQYEGSTWHGYRKPWIVTSLGRPLRHRYLDGQDAPPTQSGVIDDANLEPLDDDDPNEDESTDRPIPEDSTA